MSNPPYLTPAQIADLTERDARELRAHVATVDSNDMYTRGRASAFEDAARFVRAHSVLRYTTAAPKVTGAYWVKDLNGNQITCEVVVEDGVAYIQLMGERALVSDYPGYQWAGPLPQPVEDE